MNGWVKPAFPLRIPMPQSNTLRSDTLALSQLGPPPQTRDVDMEQGDEYEGDGEDDIDPRFRIPGPANRQPKSRKEKLLHTLVRLFLVHKGLLPNNKRQEQPHDAPQDSSSTLPSFTLRSPDPATVAAFMALKDRGPSLTDPLFFWAKPSTHPWNRLVVSILSNDFVQYLKDHQLIKLTELLGEQIQQTEQIAQKLEEIHPLQKLIVSKLDNHRLIVQAETRKISKMALEEAMTPSEISSTLERKKEESKCRARRGERRKLRFERRFNIIQSMLHSEEVSNNAELLNLWRHIESLFSYFLDADMSSDETEFEATHLVSKRVRRVRRFWISPEISKVLHFIDSNYNPRTVSGSMKRGSAPLSRSLIPVKVNKNCRPRPQMPCNFYSPEISGQMLKGLKAKPPIVIPDVPQVAQEAVTDQ